MVDNPEQAITIDVKNLVKRYPRASVNAVDDISFSVRRGEVFGLLGPNGAGKTTTIGVLTTGNHPTSGEAHIMGINVLADPMSVKQRIAVVPQQRNLDRSLRARNPDLSRQLSWSSARRAQCARRYLAQRTWIGRSWQ
ncbi:MAG TPA: ATP-binding cassette domain-containing protein [Ktedonobacteraceae bacterium]|nr:ATP-binding cassette domain-containing protein [Ktedonobacteraceae bacterium]